MGESLLTTPSENHHPSTLLSMDPTGAPSSGSSSHEDCDRVIQHHQVILSRPPDINLPLSAELSPPPQLWSPSDPCDLLDVSLATQSYETEALISHPKATARKCSKRGDSIWGAWFFFNFYFKPVLSDKSKCKVTRDSNRISGFEKSDLHLDVFLVQHDMENMYMWVFKERPENALGKMQLRSYMNGHSRLGEPQFPFSADKGFVRSHRMQRKHYRGLSNPQCIHGVEVVRSPNLTIVSDVDRRKWMELTGRDLNFSVPTEASDFGSWRNLPSIDFELERPTTAVKNMVQSHPKRLLNGSGLNLGTQPMSNGNSEGTDLSTLCCKRKKDLFPQGIDDECCLPMNSLPDHVQGVDIHLAEPPWIHEFTGVMKHATGPVTAAKTIYEDDEGYLLVVTLPLSDLQRVKVSWRNTLTHGIVKILCVSTARAPVIKRHDRLFNLTDPSPEHCPPGEYIREIPLAARIPEDATLEAYFDDSGTILEILVPKHRVGPEEHEVHVCLRPNHGGNELLLN